MKHRGSTNSPREPNLGVVEPFPGTDALFADLVVPTLGSVRPWEVPSHAH